MPGVHFQIPPPGPLLRSLFEDVLDTRVGLDFGCGEVDLGRGELLSLPAMRASTQLVLDADAPVVDNADDLENFIDWLHAPTDGLQVLGHPMVPLPTHPRRLDNLKLTDQMWNTFCEKIFERFEAANSLLIFTTAVVFPAVAEAPLFASQGFKNPDTNEILSFRIRGPMHGMTARHVLVSRGPLME
ncbi:hypothetical protein AAVH_20864 [Aphelenchoides avenae]|nr:hypothetical protein AAVH_31889 [Aphelenchus avenae]KAH7711819.1 hypothetical protein AAVH_20864 [Aphelenchus avenae]